MGSYASEHRKNCAAPTRGSDFYTVYIRIPILGFSELGLCRISILYWPMAHIGAIRVQDGTVSHCHGLYGVPTTQVGVFIEQRPCFWVLCSLGGLKTLWNVPFVRHPSIGGCCAFWGLIRPRSLKLVKMQRVKPNEHFAAARLVRNPYGRLGFGST